MKNRSLSKGDSTKTNKREEEGKEQNAGLRTYLTKRLKSIPREVRKTTVPSSTTVLHNDLFSTENDLLFRTSKQTIFICIPLAMRNESIEVNYDSGLNSRKNLFKEKQNKKTNFMTDFQTLKKLVDTQ
jgi:hypothetical protein